MKTLLPWTLSAYSAIITVWLVCTPASPPSPSLSDSREAKPPAHLQPCPLSHFEPHPPAAALEVAADSQQPLPAMWPRVESDTYGAYIQNLRAIGCPEKTIRRIITAEVHEEYEQQRREFLAKEPLPFWSSGYGVQEDSLPEMLALEAEERQALESLLGKSGANDPTHLVALTPRGVPAHKGEAIAAAEARLNAERDAILDAADGRQLTDAELARIERVQAERESGLAALLTAEEREDYELRSSAAADSLRRDLGIKGVEVTEQEFRALFSARTQFDDAAKRVADMGNAWDAYLSAAGRVLGQERLDAFK